MVLKVLGCSGSRSYGHHSPAFLVDGEMLLDAGTVGGALTAEEQRAIRSVLITHPHLDHIKGLAHLVDNLLVEGGWSPIEVVASAPVQKAIAEHLFNNVIWPDFSTLPAPGREILRWRVIETEQQQNLNGYHVTAVPVDHSVPAVGYLVKGGETTLLYTGDTGPTDRLWRYATGLSALIVEVSFPNHLEGLALRSGHLTPMLLARELEKTPEFPPRVMVMHIKSGYRELIEGELAALGISRLEILQEGAIHQL